MKRYILIMLGILFAATNLYAINWVKLDSEYSMVHKKIISNLVNGKRVKFKGNFFRTIVEHNETLASHQPDILTDLSQNKSIQIVPIAIDADERFTRYCKVKIIAPGTEYNRIIFTVYNDNEGSTAASSQHTTTSSDEYDYFSSQNPINIGHGSFGPNVSGHVPQDEINRIIAQNADNIAFNTGLSVLEGADISYVQDIVLLAHFIRQNRNPTVTDTLVINTIERDNTKYVDARKSLRGGPFFNQLKIMTTNQILHKTIKLIQNKPSITKGNVTNINKYFGGMRDVLRAALFYSASLHADNSIEFKNLVPKLSGFYTVDLSRRARQKNVLRTTQLVVSNIFYSPANSYVMGANLSKDITLAIDPNDMPITLDSGCNIENMQQHFGDCTGFVHKIAKTLHPDVNLSMRNGRFGSWDMEPAYDYMINTIYGTYKYKGVSDNRRSSNFTNAEKSKLNAYQRNYPRFLRNFNKVFEPVIQKSDIMAGDILLFRDPLNRGGGSPTFMGHAVIVAEAPSPRSNMITVIECTRAQITGARHGYGWRKIQLNRTGNRAMGDWQYTTRVMRFKR
jgi:hypothetical protein